MKKSAIILFFAAFLSISALAQTIQEGTNHFYAERYQSAKSVFDKLLATNPNNLDAVYWLGQTYIASGDINSARALYQKTLAANGNAPLIMAGMGHVDLLDGKAQEARQLFEGAITASHTKKGNDPNVLNAIGRANVQAYTEAKPLGDVNYAIAKLTEAGQLAPGNPEIFLNLGNAYRKKHDGTNAAIAYHQAGNFAPALYRAAMLYKTQNNWDVVTENLNSATAADAKFAPAYLELYEYYLRTKRDFATAQDYANKYTANADPSPDNDYLVAQTFYVQGKYSDAINLGKKMISQSQNPKPRVYRLLANSYIESKDTTDACQYATLFLSKANEDELVGNDYLIHMYSCGKDNPDIIRQDITKAVKVDSVPARQKSLMDDAIENARKNGQRELEGELRLFEYNFFYAAKPDPSQFVAIGVPFYYASQFQKADSLFKIYIAAYPDSIYGHLWDARALRQIDTSGALGLAVPEWEQQLRVAETNPSRDIYKTAGAYAATQLTVYYINVKKDREKGNSYLQRGLALNPEDETLKSIDSQLNKKSPTNQTPPKTKTK